MTKKKIVISYINSSTKTHTHIYIYIYNVALIYASSLISILYYLILKIVQINSRLLWIDNISLFIHYILYYKSWITNWSMHKIMQHVPLLKHKKLTCSKILNKFRVIWTNNIMWQVLIWLRMKKWKTKPNNFLKIKRSSVVHNSFLTKVIPTPINI